MRKLIVNANPVLPFEIFEVEDDCVTISKIHQCQWARLALDFLKDYALRYQEEIDVSFIGPESYIRHFVKEANKLEFVSATGTGA